MTNKKELNIEELEKVNGGNLYRNVNDIQWHFNLGDQVFIKLDDGVTLAEARITKRGYYYDSLFNDYADRYYVESQTAPQYSSWYLGGSNWNGNVVYKGVSYNKVVIVDEL